MKSLTDNTNTRRSGIVGIVCGILSAVCYGTNPLGALPLYQEGENTSSVLFFRFLMAVILLGSLLAVRRFSFVVNRHQLRVLALLGVLFAGSSITYYQSFHFMDAGIASTILFVYPVMVAAIMALCFHERLARITLVAVALAMAGIALLYQGPAGATLSTLGVILCILSSAFYAVYIVVIKQADLGGLPSLLITFYAMFFCMLCLLAYSFASPDLHIMLPPTPRAWFYTCWLGLVPTVLSLEFMTIAVQHIGPTPTAIMGALEPLTAVAIGVMIFGEAFTLRLAVGIVLILTGVMLIVMPRNLYPYWLR